MKFVREFDDRGLATRWLGDCDPAPLMARPLRLHLPGVPCHVMSRGNARQEIFLDAEDHLYFLRRLAVTARRFRVRCYAYCLMINHFHLLLEPSELPLSRMMQQLNGSYSQRFNQRHDRVGHLLQGRFKAFHIGGEDYFRRVLRYIARNPLRAQLVSSAVDWPWSSYRASAGLEEAPSFLAVDHIWRAFNPRNAMHAQRLYRLCVDGPVVREDDEAMRRTFVYGDTALLATVGAMLAAHRENREFTYAERFAARPPLGRLFTCACGAAERDRFMREAFECHGYTLREIGDFVGKHPTTVWRRIRRA